MNEIVKLVVGERFGTYEELEEKFKSTRLSPIPSYGREMQEQ
jgi:hypothetical protein